MEVKERQVRGLLLELLAVGHKLDSGKEVQVAGAQSFREDHIKAVLAQGAQFRGLVLVLKQDQLQASRSVVRNLGRRVRRVEAERYS